MEQRRRFNNDRNSNFSGRNNFSSAPREMHKAICSGCKKECEVPFKPTEGRDVFCADCFRSRK
ncbi:MAG: CxxC-x17-CxxC domain-containing protein [archaeon]